ncbi:MAG TPA: universal stress protein [Ktedonobacterales bacterium]
MFKHILVPVDQSQRAERAIPVAARLARATGGEITLLHVLVTPLDYATPLAPSTYAVQSYEDLQKEAEEYLRQKVESPLLATVPVSIEVSAGPPAMSILDVADEREMDSIVMTTHGRTGVTRWALGSVARQVIRHAHVSVLTLRERGRSLADAHGSQVLRALVPLDGSSKAEEAVDAAARTVTALAGPGRTGALTLAMVIDPSYARAEHAPDNLLRDGVVLYLERVVAGIVRAYPELKISWLALAETDVAAALARLAEQGVVDGVVAGESAPGVSDMIAMTTHGRTGIARLALGSITERVLEITQLPLLVVRPSSMESAENGPATSMRSESLA